MGTNFYTLTGFHIGKRSAAGMYCFDCNVSLCIAGEEKVHYIFGREFWYEKCPKCGKSPDDENLGRSSAGLELGFNKDIMEKKSGVRSCSSFTWAMDPEKFKKSKTIIVRDEYGKRYLRSDFSKMLESYPIHYKNMVGRDFS